jgi:uncharacterized membrane protein
VAAGFVFLSMGEFIALHERITARAGSMDWALTFNTHGAWIPPYMLIGLLLAWNCRMALVWAWQLEAKAVLLALGGPVFFVVGALGWNYSATSSTRYLPFMKLRSFWKSGWR